MQTGSFNLFSNSTGRPTGLPRSLLLAIGLLAVGTLLLEYGFIANSAITFWLHVLESLIAAAYIIDRALMLVKGPKRWTILQRRQFEYGVLVLFAILASGLASSSVASASAARFLHRGDIRELGIDLLKLFLLANVLVQLLRLQQRLLLRGIRPEWMLAGSFALLILAGTLLLLLPRASAAPDKPIGFLDALFTATSASCVTGLSVRDTGTEFTLFGQGSVLDLARFVGDNS